VVITRVLDDDGALIGFSKTTRDLTEQREQEERLRFSEERFRLMVEGVRDYAIFMLDPEGHVASWNLGAQQAKGYSAENHRQHFSVFYPPDVVAAGGPSANWKSRSPRAAARTKLARAQGWHALLASVVITALHDANGTTSASRRSRATHRQAPRARAGRRRPPRHHLPRHARPRTAQSARADFQRGLDHAARALESERLRMCRDVIARQLHQMTRLVDDLLDVGRITRGKIHLDLHRSNSARCCARRWNPSNRSHAAARRP
jgi:hypothetical protein